ncbi:MAG: hypothetical protein ACJAQT_000548 [Akkermansiaceae bacterium]|jgi:hypothetical protein
MKSRATKPLISAVASTSSSRISAQATKSPGKFGSAFNFKKVNKAHLVRNHDPADDPPAIKNESFTLTASRDSEASVTQSLTVSPIQGVASGWNWIEDFERLPSGPLESQRS